MSIYATIGDIGIRRFGDEKMIDIFVQAVPPHIDYVGRGWRFLPPPVDPDGGIFRAVFFVEAGTEKRGNGQEYVHPLLMLTGEEYISIGFAEVLQRLEEALDRRYGQRPSAVVHTSDGKSERVYPQE